MLRRTTILLIALTMAATPLCTIAQTPELPLPQVPASLREPAARAAYIIEHFWDAMDFSDRSRTLDDAFMEQTFSNFVSVFPYAAEDARRRAAERVMKAASVDREAYLKLAAVAEKYLWETDSPLKSEDFYIPFLEHIAASLPAGDYAAIRYRYQLEAARKNRPGALASDFAYVDRTGRSAMLRKTPAKGRMLLIFYDPDCEHCQDVMASLRDDAALSQMVADGGLKVLALSVSDDRALWEQTARQLPEAWTVGIVTSDILETQRYVLRSMPTLYLLDADKRIILKEPSVAEVVEYMGSR